MTEKNFPDIVKDIHADDNKFGKGAYFFVREALDHTLKSRNNSSSPKNGHVSGEELLEGIRLYALDRFGPITMTLMNHWNIKQCKDFGEIVFKLIDHGILGRTKSDSISDFEGGYSFDDAFEAPFTPRIKNN